MPKKTKREKLKADRLRRTHTMVPSVRAQTNDSAGEADPSPAPFSYRMSTPQVTTVSSRVATTVDVVEFAAIKRDIVKTVLLAVVAISIETLLYWKIGR